MKEIDREQEWKGKEVAKKIAKESTPEERRRNRTKRCHELLRVNRLERENEIIPNNAVKESERGLLKEGENPDKLTQKTAELPKLNSCFETYSREEKSCAIHQRIQASGT